MPPPKKQQIVVLLPLLISSLALAVSAGSFIYTIRTYAVSHRPYLGVVDGPFQFVENPPRAMTWKFVVKNVGLTRFPSNHAMQPTAGRSDAPLHFMKILPLQFTLALASGG